MSRSLLAFALLVMSASGAAASSYSAKPVVPTSDRFITRDITWNCGPDACQGSTDESRPVVLCQSLAKRAGRIDSFLVDGRALAAAQLDQCNAAAKPVAGRALAAQ